MYFNSIGVLMKKSVKWIIVFFICQIIIFLLVTGCVFIKHSPEKCSICRTIQTHEIAE